MGVYVVFKKELRDMFSSKRFLILVLLFMLFYVAGFYFLAATGLTQIRRPLLFLLSSYVSVLTYMAPLLGIAFGYDAIAGERERGTLKTVLAQPIYRDSFILGKLLAFLVLTSVSLFASTLISLGIFVAAFGGSVTLDEVARISIISLAAVLLSLTYYSISLLFSVHSRKSSHSALISISVWIIIAVVLPLIASMVAFASVGPPPSFAASKSSEQFREWARKFNQARSSIMRLSPNTYFEDVARTLLRVIAAPGAQRAGGGIPLRETASVTTSLAVLSIVPLILMIVSFLVFVRQEEK